MASSSEKRGSKTPPFASKAPHIKQPNIQKTEVSLPPIYLVFYFETTRLIFFISLK